MDDVVDNLEILPRRRDRPADTLNRLGDEASDFAGCLVADQVLDVTGTLDVATGYSRPIGAAIAIAGRRVFDAEVGLF